VKERDNQAAANPGVFGPQEGVQPSPSPHVTGLDWDKGWGKAPHCPSLLLFAWNSSEQYS
jgi:hypothetical protein